ncbi:MAG: right-handed parallel beta-helix repeat-containing protein, partial [candidate division KSB1 bacterium]|nr:right-handed parallel beta-helix repeat-containing protein [candidate division KSB1 bacterium]
MKIWLMLSALSALLSAQEIYLFVSPQGNDEWSGKSPEPVGKEGPFATLKRAQEEIRNLQEKGGLSAPVTVFLRGGFYSLREPIVFLPEDSGSKDAPITYCNYQNERVVLSGGRIITYFRPEGAYWTAEIPDVRNGSYRFQQLFVNGQRRFRARTPNKGWFRVRDPMESKQWPFHHYRYQFGYNPQDLSPLWRNLEDVEIVLLHFWSDAHCPIRAIDAEKSIVTLATPAWRPFTDDYSKRGARYFVDNVFEGLDEPGEWYLDRREGKLYYLPLPDEDIRSAQVIAPDLDQLIIFQGEPLFGRYAHHIRLQGLTFSHNDWFLPPGDPGDHFGADTVPGALKIVGGRDLTIENCRFEHLGTYAVEVRDGSRRITFRRNVIDDI